MKFAEKLSNDNEFIILDGAMGTMLQKHGLVAGEYPEKFNFTQEEIVYKIQKAYIDAGSDVVYANTFGSNALKLAKIGYSVKEVVEKAISIARRAAQDKFVALDIGAIGQLMEPLGTLSFAEAYELFKQQMVIGEKAGADLIIIETMSDIYELKAAVLAAKENTKLPVICTMTFQDNGRTLTGTDPETMVHILESLGVDGLGLNCSLGPKQMLSFVEKICNAASIPVCVKPNAGLPKYIDGQTVFELKPEVFGKQMRAIAQAGAKLLGGCCGTSPEFIISLRENLEDLKPVQKEVKHFPVICSSTKSVYLNDGVKMIGERINPTSRKKIKYALRENDLNVLINEAVNQRDAGADVLDVNVGIPEIDEVKTLVTLTKELQSMIDTPLQFDSSNVKALEEAVRIYNGKPIINSVNGKLESMEEIFPIVKKYGTMVIALTLDERGLPKSVEDRIEIAEKIIKTAKSYGIPKESLIFDCLVLTASVQQKQVMHTLNALALIKEKFGVMTTLGASNISFGLPKRKILNSTYLAMALTKGVDAPITDPLSNDVQNIFAAFRVLTNQDPGAKEYINRYNNIPEDTEKAIVIEDLDIKDISVEEIVLKGLKSKIESKIRMKLEAMHPMDIVNRDLIPALDVVGEKYEKNEIFLPQLIRSAETVKIGFKVVQEKLKKAKGSDVCKGTIVFATVKGDIHDIGKNIVKILLENYGFKVIDLGKDVPIEKVVKSAYENKVKLVGLSALMTTTVETMKATIKALKSNGLDCEIMVGGAVLNKEYSKMINANYYGKNAWEAVNIARKVFNV